MEYQAKLTREGRQWLVEFPDCPGCQTYDSSRSAALSAAREALEGWLEAHLVTGDAPPRPKRRRGLVGVSVSARLSVALALRWYRLDEGLTVAQAARRAKVATAEVRAIEDPDEGVLLESTSYVFTRLGLQVDVQLGAA